MDHIHHAERVAIGHSTLWQLHTAALDILAEGSDASIDPAIAMACVELVLLALARRLRVDEKATDDACALHEIVDTYPRPAAVLGGLINFVHAAAASVRVERLLGVEEANRAAEGGMFAKGGVAMALAASASGLGLQMGLNDAFYALSARLPIRALMKGGSTDVREGVAELGMDPYALPAELGGGSPRVDGTEEEGMGEGGGNVAEGKSVLLAERALELLCVLCVPRGESPFRDALYMLRDVEKGEEEQGGVVDSFSKLYETLGRWMAHPTAALFAYYLLTGSRRFRIFTLARTDPDVLLIPLLASLRKRCLLGHITADAYIPAAIILMLTADKGFCEAIDMITIPNSALDFVEGTARSGNEEIALSGITLLVCSRVAQQSLVLRRRVPDCFLAGVCLSIMTNVSGDVTSIHPLAAERLLSLVEFLGRRRKKAIFLVAHSEDMPMEPPRISDSPRGGAKEMSDDRLEGMDMYTAASAKLSAFEKSEAFLDRLADFIGLSLEAIVSVLRSRSVVSANRHLVYTLLHREAVLDSEQVSKPSTKCEALSHMLQRMIGFFGTFIDEDGDRRGSKTEGKVKHIRGAPTGISVERVFHIIDRKARHLPQNVFEGLPEVRFKYDELERSEEFVEPYSWSLVLRSSKDEWDLHKVVLAVSNDKFHPSR